MKRGVGVAVLIANFKLRSVLAGARRRRLIARRRLHRVTRGRRTREGEQTRRSTLVKHCCNRCVSSHPGTRVIMFTISRLSSSTLVSFVRSGPTCGQATGSIRRVHQGNRRPMHARNVSFASPTTGRGGGPGSNNAIVDFEW